MIIGWRFFNTEQWWTSKKKYSKDIIIIIIIIYFLNYIFNHLIRFYCLPYIFVVKNSFVQLYFTWNTQYEIWNNIDFCK